MKIVHWFKKLFCHHEWYRHSGIYHDKISMAQWFYCPKCDNWLHARYGSQCCQPPYTQKIFLGGNK